MASKKDREILQRLAEEGQKRGLSPHFIEASQRLFSIQSNAERRIGKAKSGLVKEVIDERLSMGLPMLDFSDLNLDWTLVKEVYHEITAHFADYTDLFGELPRRLRRPKSRNTLPKRVVKAWFKGAGLPSAIAVDNVGEYVLLEAVIQSTMRPFLVSFSKALIGFVDQERWRRNYCPVCGGRPDFAYLDEERGARWLLCSRCDSEWLYQRLQCPYCGTEEQGNLAYFTDDKGAYRLYVCDKCHKYIKAIDFRVVNTRVILPLERILTLDMDRQAEEKGYHPDHSEALTSSTD